MRIKYNESHMFHSFHWMCIWKCFIVFLKIPMPSVSCLIQDLPWPAVKTKTQKINGYLVITAYGAGTACRSTDDEPPAPPQSSWFSFRILPLWRLISFCRRSISFLWCSISSTWCFLSASICSFSFCLQVEIKLHVCFCYIWYLHSPEDCRNKEESSYNWPEVPLLLGCSPLPEGTARLPHGASSTPTFARSFAQLAKLEQAEEIHSISFVTQCPILLTP